MIGRIATKNFGLLHPIVLVLCGALHVHAQTTAFTYQGFLTDSGSPANGTYDLRFAIYDSANDGAIIAGPLIGVITSVSNGLFTVLLDFGPGVFSGPGRWLEIGVWSGANPVGYQILSPRLPFTSTPYAQTAQTAQSLSGDVAASQLSGTLPQAALAGAYSGSVVLSNTDNWFFGTYAGDGSGLTNVPLGNLNPNQFSGGSTTNIRSGVQLTNAFFGGPSGTAGFSVGSNNFGIFGGHQLAPGSVDFTNIYVGVNLPNTGPGQWIDFPDQGGIGWKDQAGIYDYFGIHVAGRGLLLINGGTDIEITPGRVTTPPHPELNLGGSPSTHEWIKLKPDTVNTMDTNHAQGFSKALVFDGRGIQPNNISTIYVYPGIVGFANPYSPTNWINDYIDGPVAPGGGELRFYAHVPDFTASYPANRSFYPDHNPGLEIFRASTNGISLVSTNGAYYGNGAGLTNLGVSGSASLSGGTNRISTSAVQLASKIMLTYVSLDGTWATPFYRTSEISPGSAFTIRSSNPADTNMVNWFIVP